jgi:hypothetical protein
MERADVGNLYDRSLRQTYTSSVFTWPQSCTQARAMVKAQVPDRSRLEFSWRAAATPDALPSRPWTVRAGANIPLQPTDRCLQYRVIFVSDNGDRYPELDRVEVTFD